MEKLIDIEKQFLHLHPTEARIIGLNEDHVIVDAEDMKILMRFLDSDRECRARLNIFLRKQKEYHIKHKYLKI